MGLIFKKDHPLIELNLDMIKGNILIVPEGITEIKGRLDQFLTQAKIDTPIKAVIFPRSLKTLDNFFYYNDSVEDVIFNSSPALTSCYAEGTFEGCKSLKTLLIPYGFKEVVNTPYTGVLKNSEQFLVKHSLNDPLYVCLSFLNCSLDLLIIATNGSGNYVDTASVGHVEQYYCAGQTNAIGNIYGDDDITTLGWHKISYLLYNRVHFIISERNVISHRISIDDFQDEVRKVLKKYMPSDKIRRMNVRKPIVRGIPSPSIK